MYDDDTMALPKMVLGIQEVKMSFILSKTKNYNDKGNLQTCLVSLFKVTVTASVQGGDWKLETGKAKSSGLLQSRSHWKLVEDCLKYSHQPAKSHSQNPWTARKVEKKDTWCKYSQSPPKKVKKENTAKKILNLHKMSKGRKWWNGTLKSADGKRLTGPV